MCVTQVRQTLPWKREQVRIIGSRLPFLHSSLFMRRHRVSCSPVSDHVGAVSIIEALAYRLLRRHTDFRGVMPVRLSAIIWPVDAAPFDSRGQAARLW
jgi:hypothetical protein